MIAGLPWESWLLLAVAVGLGLGIELLFFRAQRRARRRDGTGGDERDGPRPGEDPAPGEPVP